MISKSFDEKDFEKYSGQTMYGRIKEYSHSRGYGFIFTEEGNIRLLASAWIFVKGFGLCFFQNQKRVRVSLFPGRKSGERGWIHSGSKGILSGAGRAIL